MYKNVFFQPELHPTVDIASDFSVPTVSAIVRSIRHVCVGVTP